ncbi:uncharacterized protein LOC143485687 isoform X3 [Brachyhypopomus gauderio]
MNSEVKKKKKQRWWRHIESSSLTQVTDTQSLNVSSSSISCSSSSEGHLTRSNNKLPTEPKNTEGIVPGQSSESFMILSLCIVCFSQRHLLQGFVLSIGAADKDVCSVPMDRFPAVVVEGDFRVQNLQHLLPHIVSSERVTESGQGEGQGHAPTVSAGRDTEIRQLGFPNIGNTCYMNATLQCLLSLSCFWSPIRAQCSSWTDPSSCQMLRCFADLQQGRLTSRSSSKKKKLLRALNACISVRCPAFGEDYEQDAHEFLMMCLLQLKEEGETLRVSSFSYICPVANFEFHLKSVRTCSSCGLQSSRVEDFNHLSVNLSSTLTDSLHNYFKSTVLEFKCECGQGTEACEVVEFFTLPRTWLATPYRRNQNSRRAPKLVKHMQCQDGVPGTRRYVSRNFKLCGPAGSLLVLAVISLKSGSSDALGTSIIGQGLGSPLLTGEIRTQEGHQSSLNTCNVKMGFQELVDMSLVTSNYSWTSLSSLEWLHSGNR